MVTTSNENQILLVNQLSKQVAYFNEQDLIINNGGNNVNRGGINLLFIENTHLIRNRNRINNNNNNNDNILFDYGQGYTTTPNRISGTEKIVKFLSKLKHGKKDKLKVHCITLYW